ncbi:hypothetical protein GYMLUDRAFT_580804 [Collybiopsis luxurians FD-317 M1]|uniref:Uncharacterized protein n=1 Tax=Collybiopsis luxurians FD-317 M1 TaxID=944289 RepID=A0A0D0CYC7_9AGAR|nr:hypothetical protein GYMLUDRAFT_580804 [Collybiopsis luxurians FD-317 M1]
MNALASYHNHQHYHYLYDDDDDNDDGEYKENSDERGMSASLAIHASSSGSTGSLRSTWPPVPKDGPLIPVPTSSPAASSSKDGDVEEPTPSLIDTMSISISTGTSRRSTFRNNEVEADARAEEQGEDVDQVGSLYSGSASESYTSSSFLLLDPEENGEVASGSGEENQDEDEDEVYEDANETEDGYDDGMTASPIQPFPSTASLCLALPEEETVHGEGQTYVAFNTDESERDSIDVTSMGEIPAVESEPESDAEGVEVWNPWVPRPFEGPLYPSDSYQNTLLPNPYSPQPPQPQIPHPHSHHNNRRPDSLAEFELIRSLNPNLDPVPRSEDALGLKLDVPGGGVGDREAGLDIHSGKDSEGRPSGNANTYAIDEDEEAEVINGPDNTSDSVLAQEGEIRDIPDVESLQSQDRAACGSEEDELDSATEIDTRTICAHPRAASRKVEEEKGRSGGGTVNGAGSDENSTFFSFSSESQKKRIQFPQRAGTVSLPLTDREGRRNEKKDSRRYSSLRLSLPRNISFNIPHRVRAEDGKSSSLSLLSPSISHNDKAKKA